MHTLIIYIAKYLIIVPALAWVAVLWWLPKKQRLSFVVHTAIAGVFALVLIKLGTTLYHDPRPFVRDGVHPYFASSNDNGFPSDHTAASSLVAFLVLRFRRNIGLLLIAVALLIGTARVISGVHHGIDIAGGLVFAALAVLVAWPLEQQVTKQLVKRLSKQ